MRKWIVLLIALLVGGFGAAYFLIPDRLSIKQTEKVSFPAKAFSRALLNEVTWQQWWPGEKKSATTFFYNGNTFSIREKKVSSLMIDIFNGKDTLLSELVLIPLKADSIELEWLGTLNSPANFYHRIQKSSWVQEIASNMGTLLRNIKDFYTQTDNLYPFVIREVKVVDSILISTSTTSHQYPTTELIYSLLDKLKAYAEMKGAEQTGFPMLNITSNSDNTYLVRVALPIDKKLPNTSDIQYRWMLGGGNILVTEIKGGPHKIQQAFSVMEQYVDDFNRLAPAIPFQSLVIDRRGEPDTSKWVTKIYWPVM